MSYNEFFGFSDSPFLDVPDLKFLFLAKQHEQVLAELGEFITSRQGIAVVSGDDGVGKTVLAHALLERIPPSFQPLEIIRPAAKPLAITHMIAQSLAVTLREGSLVNLTPLADAFQEAARQGNFFLLLLDDAHLLTDQHLEEIYIISQMEQQGQQLMPIILVGRKGLGQKLASNVNQRLRNLVHKNLSLTGLTFEETTRYIDHRLKHVGSSFAACFADGCAGQLFSRTGGIPRRINQVCDQALNRAWQENRNRVTRDLLGDQEPTPFNKPLAPPPRWSFLKSSGAVLAGLLVISLAGYVLYINYLGPAGKTSPPVVDTAVPPAKTLPAPPEEKTLPAPVTVSPPPPPDQADPELASQPASPTPDLKASEEPEPSRELTREETATVPPPDNQAPAPETPRAAAHKVAPEDGGLLKIVAVYYPDDQEIAYDAVILANPRIANEDIIYPGQNLSLPKIDKEDQVITLSNNQHYRIYQTSFISSEVERAVSTLKERQVPFLVRKTWLLNAGPIYRIFVGGFESKEELKEAMALAKKN
jgi:type II secretory pathway predicted ATPase ExeA